MSLLSRALLPTLLSLAAGCATPFVFEPTLGGRATPVALRTLPDNTIQIGDWLLTGWTAPALRPRDHADGRGQTPMGMRSSLAMRAPDGGAWTGECEYTSSSGSLLTSSQSAMSCDFQGPGGRRHLLLAGRDTEDLFAPAAVHGDTHGPSFSWEHVPAPTGAADSVRAVDSIETAGTLRVLFFYRSRETARYYPEHRMWSAACCTQVETVATISVWNPEVISIVPGLEAEMRTDVMLTAGALVSVRGVSTLPAMR